MLVHKDLSVFNLSYNGSLMIRSDAALFVILRSLELPDYWATKDTKRERER